MSRIRVGLVYGGRSAEREVSNLSAEAVYKHLNPEKYDVYPVSVSETGVWRSLPPGQGLPTLGREEESLARGTAIGAEPARLPLPGCTEADATATGQPKELDVVFPLIHGTYGEDGSLQGFLELCGVPYVGAGVSGSALGMDKSLMRDVLRAHGVPGAAHIDVRRLDWESAPAAERTRIEEEIGYPCFVKPARTGSSVGISKASDRETLNAAMVLACRYDSMVVIEEALPVREIECGVIGNGFPEASVLGEVTATAEFYDYHAKYLAEDTRITIPAEIDDTTAEEARALALKAYRVLRCSGFARVDMFLHRETGDLYLNEINTIPGFTSHSMFSMLWEASGVPYGELLDRLIEYALERSRDERRNEVTVPEMGLLP